MNKAVIGTSKFQAFRGGLFVTQLSPKSVLNLVGKTEWVEDIGSKHDPTGKRWGPDYQL